MFKPLFRIFLSCICVVVAAGQAWAQHSLRDTDEEYIRYDPDMLTVRTFLSRKVNGYQVGEQGRRREAEYSPNDLNGAGLGFTYRFIGINLNFRAPILNRSDDKRGTTRSFDLASYAYLRKFTIDAIAQVYKGHYLSDNDLLNSNFAGDVAGIRPDLQTTLLGVNAHYIFNHRRFSYRSSFLQSEWQHKSAGSFLAGVNMHYVHIRADSSVVPAATALGKDLTFDHSSIYSVGFDGGYAYTFVYNTHWFTTLALMVGGGFNNTRFEDRSLDRQSSAFGPHFNSTVRFAVGYNSRDWFAGFFYVNFLSRNYADYSGHLLWQQTENGLYRLVVAKRISLRRKK